MTEQLSLKGWLFEHGFQSWIAPRVSIEAASMAYALCYVLIWLLLMIPLYRGKVFIRI